MGSRCGSSKEELPVAFVPFNETLSAIFEVLTFFVFGSLIVGTGFSGNVAALIAFIVFALCLARPAAIGVGFLGTLMRREGRVFIAWFGPKGVASMLFALFVLHSDAPARGTEFEIASFVILASILVHGASDSFGVRWISRRIEGPSAKIDTEDSAPARPPQARVERAEARPALGQTAVDLRVGPAGDRLDLGVGAAGRLQRQGAPLLRLQAREALGEGGEALAALQLLRRIGRRGADELRLEGQIAVGLAAARPAEGERLAAGDDSHPCGESRRLDVRALAQQDLDRPPERVLGVLGTGREAARSTRKLRPPVAHQRGAAGNAGRRLRFGDRDQSGLLHGPPTPARKGAPRLSVPVERPAIAAILSDP